MKMCLIDAFRCLMDRIDAFYTVALAMPISTPVPGLSASCNVLFVVQYVHSCPFASSNE